VPSGCTNNFPESERGLGHVTLTIFGSTVGYPSDSLASCSMCVNESLLLKCDNFTTNENSCLKSTAHVDCLHRSWTGTEVQPPKLVDTGVCLL